MKHVRLLLCIVCAVLLLWSCGDGSDPADGDMELSDNTRETGDGDTETAFDDDPDGLYDAADADAETEPDIDADPGDPDCPDLELNCVDRCEGSVLVHCEGYTDANGCGNQRFTSTDCSPGWCDDVQGAPRCVVTDGDEEPETEDEDDAVTGEAEEPEAENVL